VVSGRRRSASSAVVGAALVMLSTPVLHAQGQSFLARPGSVPKAGDKSTLSWTYPGATSCTIIYGTGQYPDLGATGSHDVFPQVTTTYELACTASTTLPSLYVTVEAPPPVTIKSLTATPATIVAGDNAMLAVTASKANGCEAEMSGSGMSIPFVPTTPCSQDFCGSLPVSPPYTATYRATCKGLGKEQSSLVEIRVEGAVAIGEFTATPQRVNKGDASRLAWRALNAKSCLFDPGRITVVATDGSAEPVLDQSTNFRLTCTGWNDKQVQAAVTVMINQP
jgi:hypothetical protein